MSEHSVREFLAQHPRMMGVLFAATALMWESGIVLATTESSSNGGP